MLAEVEKLIIVVALLTKTKRDARKETFISLKLTHKNTKVIFST